MLLFLEQGDQDVVLVFEVNIDGPVRHPGLAGDIRYLGLEKTLFREDPGGRLDDPVIFLGILSLRHECGPF